MVVRGHLNYVVVELCVGAATALMMYPILEDWSFLVTVALTAALYFAAGFVLRRMTKRRLWYASILMNVPFWLLFLSWGLPRDQIIDASLVTAFLASFAGSII